MVMKTKYLFPLVLLAFVLPLVAQVTNTAPVLGSDPLPETKETLWMLVIAIITPGIVWAIAKIPNIPKPFLPSITPFIGFLLGLALNALAKADLPWYSAVQAGALAVFVREAINQWVTAKIKEPEKPYPVTGAKDKALAST